MLEKGCAFPPRNKVPSRRTKGVKLAKAQRRLGRQATESSGYSRKASTSTSSKGNFTLRKKSLSTVHHANPSGPQDGCSPCNDVGDPFILPPPILNLCNLLCLKNDHYQNAAASSSLITISVTLNSGGNSIENSYTSGGSLGISLASCAQKENVIQEEEISIYGWKGIEGYNGTQSVLCMWSC